MNISVIGCGRWGTFLAWYISQINKKVVLYGREGSDNMDRLKRERNNGIITLPDSVDLTTDIACVDIADVIVISIASQGLESLMQQLAAKQLRNKIIVLCMKGLEVGTGRRLSEIVEDNLDRSNSVAVWLGPGHVQEFYNGIPNCMVIDSRNDDVKRILVEELSSKIIRFYYGQDIIGNEIGAATKNVIGIAAGMLDGHNISSLKGALMSRATREISRLIEKMGGNKMSAYGLCHLGDYEATVFSRYSHNREFGERFVKGFPFDKLAEGYYTVSALRVLQEKYSVDLPICMAVYRVLYEKADSRAELDKLFERSIKNEF